jgi:hypothetical protein
MLVRHAVRTALRVATWHHGVLSIDMSATFGCEHLLMTVFVIARYLSLRRATWSKRHQPLEEIPEPCTKIKLGPKTFLISIFWVSFSFCFT